MKKRCLSVFLALALCMGLCAVPAFAAGPNFVIENGVLTHYNGPGGNVVIPSTVTRIASHAFDERDDITNITIPNSVTEIDGNALYHCGGLTSISIPASVTQIGMHLTHWCGNLAEIRVDSGNPNYASRNGVLFSKDMKTLIEYPAGKAGAYTVPNGVVTLSAWAFTECVLLTGLTLPGSVSTIQSFAFYNCTGLETISLAEGLTTIEYAAFTGCEKLTSLSIPASVTFVGPFPVQGCYALTSIEVDPRSDDLASVDGVLYTKGLEYLIACPPAKSGAFNVPDGVVEIVDNAFACCYYITSVTIPGSVRKIDNSAFYKCTGLTSLTIADGVTEIGPSAFDSCTGLTEVTLPSSVTTLGYSPFTACSKLASITVDPGNSAYTSVDGVLYSKDTKTLVEFPSGKAADWTIPGHVTSIGDFAFSGDNVLTSITIPNHVVKLGRGAFSDCTALTHVVLPDSITAIERFTFTRCDSLISVTIPSSVTEIDEYAFDTDADVIIYGEKGSAAERYAEEYDGVSFVAGSAPIAPAFTDVPAGEFYAAPVAWAVKGGITNGTSDTAFSPGEECTQGQILTFLYRAARGGGAATAADMDKAVAWAKENNMIDGSFDGSAPCTRATAVNYIWQAFTRPEAEKSGFTDVPAGADYAAAVDWAVETGITNGDGSETIFSPDKVCTRGQIVTFLHRAYVPEARLTAQ